MDNLEWFRKAVIYHVLIDRFNGTEEKNSKCEAGHFCGGNLRGVIEKLDYLKKLGISVIWLSPFYKTDSYHGYHIIDFFRVDDRFGSNEILKELIGEAEARKIKIIADFAPNHVSAQHPFFLDAISRKDSPYREWFCFKKWPDEYVSFLDFGWLPKINLENKDARGYIVKAAKFWLSLGVAGFRLDHIIGPSHNFWKYFHAEIKKDYPEAVLIGEAWMRGTKLKNVKTMGVRGRYYKWLRKRKYDNLFLEYVGEMDGVMDFKFQDLVKKYFIRKKIFRPKWLLNWRLKRHYEKYPKDFFLPSFLDNHDMNRFLYQADGDKETLKSAACFQFKQDQPVVIYYGAEIGMSQEGPMSSMGCESRQMMDWENIDYSLVEFYKKLISKKRGETVLFDSTRANEGKGLMTKDVIKTH